MAYTNNMDKVDIHGVTNHSTNANSSTNAAQHKLRSKTDNTNTPSMDELQRDISDTGHPIQTPPRTNPMEHENIQNVAMTQTHPLPQSPPPPSVPSVPSVPPPYTSSPPGMGFRIPRRVPIALDFDEPEEEEEDEIVFSSSQYFERPASRALAASALHPAPPQQPQSLPPSSSRSTSSSPPSSTLSSPTFSIPRTSTDTKDSISTGKASPPTLPKPSLTISPPMPSPSNPYISSPRPLYTPLSPPLSPTTHNAMTDLAKLGEIDELEPEDEVWNILSDPSLDEDVDEVTFPFDMGAPGGRRHRQAGAAGAKRKLKADEAIFSVARMTEIIEHGSEDSKKTVLVELMQVWEAYLKDTLLPLVPVLCQHCVSWDTDLLLFTGDTLLEILDGTQMEASMARSVVNASFHVISKHHVEEIYELWGEILITAIPMAKWEDEDMDHALRMIDNYFGTGAELGQKLAARIIGSLSNCTTSDQTTSILLPRALQLCGNPNLEVRGMTVESMAFLGAALPVDLVEAELWPMMEQFLADPDARIHAAALRSLCHMLSAHEREDHEQRYPHLLEESEIGLSGFERKASLDLFDRVFRRSNSSLLPRTSSHQDSDRSFRRLLQSIDEYQNEISRQDVGSGSGGTSSSLPRGNLKKRMLAKQLPAVFLDMCDSIETLSAEDQRIIDDDSNLLLEISGEVFGQLLVSSVFGDDSILVKDAAMKALFGMATCMAPVIRRHCAFNLPGMISVLKSEYGPELGDVLEFLSRDPDSETRWNIAAGFHVSLRLLASKAEFPTLLEAMFNMLRDQDLLVRMTIFEHFHKIYISLNLSHYEELVLKKLEMFFGDLISLVSGNWRMQQVFAEQVEKCIQFFPAVYLKEHVLPPLLQIAEEGVYTARQSLLRVIVVIIRYIGSSDLQADVVQELGLTWGQSDVFWKRSSYIEAVFVASQTFSRERFRVLFSNLGVDFYRSLTTNDLKSEDLEDVICDVESPRTPDGATDLIEKLTGPEEEGEDAATSGQQQQQEQQADQQQRVNRRLRLDEKLGSVPVPTSANATPENQYQNGDVTHVASPTSSRSSSADVYLRAGRSSMRLWADEASILYFARDPVPNVRIKLASHLDKLYYSMGNNPCFERAVNLLRDDEDIDVRDAIQGIDRKLAKLEAAKTGFELVNKERLDEEHNLFCKYEDSMRHSGSHGHHSRSASDAYSTT